MTERLEYGEVNQQIRRRPGLADAKPRPTADGFPRRREDSVTAGAVPAGFARLTQSIRSRPAGRRRTATYETVPWNSSTNRSANGSTNDATTLTTSREEKTRLRTGWELPELLRPLPVRHQRCFHKPRLQPHQPAIVEYVYQSRFATASQVQRRYPNWLRTARTTQWQLANLTELGYLATVPVRSTAPNFPFVYFATGKGVTLINDTYAAHGIDRRHPLGEGRKASGVAVESILHELLLTEFELAVQQTVASRLDLSLLATERRYYRRDRHLSFQQAGQTHRVVPDTGFVLQAGKPLNGVSQNNSLATMLFLIELDNGTMPVPRVLQKLRQYAVWAAYDEGERYLYGLYARFGATVPQNGFRLAIVAHDKLHADGDKRRLAALMQQALTLPASMRDRLWFATAADLKAHQSNSAPLAGRLWYRGRDANTCHFMSSSTTEHKANTSAHHFVAASLPSLPRHPLFPLPIQR